MVRRICISLFIFSIVLLGIGGGVSFSLGASQGVSVGSEAPDFELDDVDGNKVSLSSFRGKNPVLLVFWASWCPYCVKEIPDLKKLDSKYKDKGLKIIGVNVRENPKAVSNFVKKKAVDYTVVMDRDGSVSSSYKVLGIPTNVLIDKEGAIAHNQNALPDNNLFDRVVNQ